MHVASENTVTVDLLLAFLCKPCVFLECTLTCARDPMTCLSAEHCPSQRREDKVLETIYCRDPIL